MTFHFRPAKRENVGLLIGITGPSGSGKTFSAMRLASGICGKDSFAVIDTEARRALHYADHFKFDHCEMRSPFSPMAYIDAIAEADKAGYKAILVDSMSHEWAGEGGVLDMQETELQRMAGDDWKKREACKMAAWIKPKMQHKQMVQRLLQVRAHLILCLRAEEKVEMLKQKDDRGYEKTVIVPKGWQPVCGKDFPYELTVSFMLTPEKPGIPQPIKIQDQHRHLFPIDKQVTEESGRLLAEWATGAAPAEKDLAKDQQPVSWYWIGKDDKVVKWDNPVDWRNWIVSRLPKMSSMQCSELDGRMAGAFTKLSEIDPATVGLVRGMIQERYTAARDAEEKAQEK